MKQDARRRKKGEERKDFRFSMNRWREKLRGSWEKNHVFDSLFEETGDRGWLYRSKLLARILSGRRFWVDITCPTSANETPGRQKSRRQAVRKWSWRCTDSPFLKWEEQRGAAVFKYSERGSAYLPVSMKNKTTVHNNDADDIEIIYKGKGWQKVGRSNNRHVRFPF